MFFSPTRPVTKYLAMLLTYLLLVSSFQQFYANSGTTAGYPTPIESQPNDFLANSIVIDAFGMADQTVTHQTAQGKQTFSLSEPNTLNPYTGFASTDLLDFSAELGSSEIRISIGEKGKTHTHSIKVNGKITAIGAQLPGSHYFTVATTTGVYVVPVKLAQALIFKGPVPIIRILPPPPAKDAVITQINLIDPQIPFSETPITFENKGEQDLIFKWDIDLTIEAPSFEKPIHHLVGRMEMMNAIADRLIYFLLFSDVLEPGQKPSSSVAPILEKHQKKVLSLLSDYGAFIDGQVGDKQDAVQFAIAQFARRGGSDVLEEVLTPDARGVSLMDEMSRSSRDIMSVKELQTSWDEELKRRNGQTNSQMPGDLSTVVIAKQNADLMTAAAIASKFKQLFTVKKLIKIGAFLRSSKGKKLSKVMGGVIVAASSYYTAQYGIDQLPLDLQNGIREHGVNMLSTIAGLMDQVAMPEYIATPLKTAVGQAGDWVKQFTNVYKFAMGAGMLSLYLMIQNITIRIAGQAKIEGYKGSENWSAARKFFTFGTRIIAKLSYPFQALIWEKLLKQQLAYNTLDHKTDPRKTQRSGSRLSLPLALHTPWASEKAILARSEQVNAQIQQNAQVKTTAEYLAALAVVSEMEKVDITTLISVDKMKSSISYFQNLGVAQKTLVLQEFLAKPEYRTVWQQLFPMVYESLNHYAREVEGPIDEAAFKFYVEKAQLVAKEIKAIKNPTVSALVKGLWRRSASFFSGDALKFAVWGSAGRTFSLDLRNAVVNNRTADVAAEGVIADYRISAIFMFAVDPALYMNTGRALFETPYTMGSNISTGTALDLAGSWSKATAGLSSEALRDLHLPFTIAGEQTALNGTVGPLQAFRTDGMEAYNEENGPRGLDLKDKDGNTITENPKEQTIKEAVASLKSNFSFRHAFQDHANLLERLTGSSVQGQLLVGAFFIVPGFIAASVLTGATDVFTMGGFLQTFALGLGTQFYILMLKYGFTGYAVVWPYVHALTHAGNDRIIENQFNIKVSRYLIEAGIRAVDSGTTDKIRAEWLDRGIDLMKQLYQQGTSELGPEFDKPSAAYSTDDAINLLKQSLVDPPVATVANKKIFKYAINYGLGGIGSTILYLMIYKSAFNLTEVMATQGGGAAFSAYMVNLTTAVAILVGSYIGVAHLPKILSKENFKLYKDAFLTSLQGIKRNLSSAWQCMGLKGRFFNSHR